MIRQVVYQVANLCEFSMYTFVQVYIRNLVKIKFYAFVRGRLLKSI